MSGLFISCSGTWGQSGGGPEILAQGTAGLGSQPPVAGVDAGRMAARQARCRWQRRPRWSQPPELNVVSPVSSYPESNRGEDTAGAVSGVETRYDRTGSRGGLLRRRVLRPLRGYTRYRVDQSHGYERLLRHLTNQPLHRKPEPGPLRHLPPGPPLSQSELSRLSGVTAVPKPPPHYLPRPEILGALKAKLLAKHTARLGIMSVRQAVGVQGMGGIGKSVVVAAAVVGVEVKKLFPDGVFWVAVGQQPDLVRLQVERRLDRPVEIHLP